LQSLSIFIATVVGNKKENITNFSPTGLGDGKQCRGASGMPAFHASFNLQGLRSGPGA
jgi:hypothetical protein